MTPHECQIFRQSHHSDIQDTKNPAFRFQYSTVFQKYHKKHSVLSCHRQVRPSEFYPKTPAYPHTAFPSPYAQSFPDVLRNPVPETDTQPLSLPVSADARSQMQFPFQPFHHPCHFSVDRQTTGILNIPLYPLGQIRKNSIPDASAIYQVPCLLSVNPACRLPDTMHIPDSVIFHFPSVPTVPGSSCVVPFCRQIPFHLPRKNLSMPIILYQFPMLLIPVQIPNDPVPAFFLPSSVPLIV